jgi:hypothetical protein
MARPKERLDGQNRMEVRVYDLEHTVRTLEAQVRAMGDVVGALRVKVFAQMYGIGDSYLDKQWALGRGATAPQVNQAHTPASPEGAP